MKITNIHGVNVKGQTFDHKIEPLTVISGANASGKTAITDAMVIGMLGHHPSLGKTNKSTALLAGPGAVMEVGVEFDNGGVITRTWGLNKESTSLKSTGSAKDIKLEIGSFDVEAFISAPLNNKLETIARTLPVVETTTPDELAERINNSEDSHLTEGWRGSGLTFDEQRKEAEEIRRDLRAEKKMLEETISGLELLGLDDDEIEPPTAKEIELTEEALENVSKKLNSKNQLLTELKSKQSSKPSQKEPTLDDVENLEGEYLDLGEKVDEAKNQESKFADITEKCKTLKAYLTKKENDNLEYIEIAENNKELNPWIGNKDKKVDWSKQIQDRQNLWSQAKATKLMKEDELEIAQKERDDLLEAEECPCCKSKGSDFKAAIKKISKSKIAGIKREITKADKELDFCKTEVEQVTIAAQVVRGREAILEINVGEAELRILEKQLPATGVEDTSAMRAKLIELARQITQAKEIRKQWDHHRAFSTREAEIPAIESEIGALEEDQDDKKQALAELRSKRESGSKLVNDRKRQSESRARLKLNKSKQSAFASLIKTIKEAELKAAKSAFAPMAKVTAVFLRGVMQGKLAMSGSDIGVERDGQFINFSTLSGAEQLAAGCAIKAAIANASEAKILIADEIARMTIKLRKQFAENCAKAIKLGVIDQAVLIDHEGAIEIGHKISVK